MYAIEKSIPVPKKDTKWGFIKSMEPGDSFFVPSADYKDFRRIYSSIYTIMKRHGFTPRKQKQDGGFRVWRVE